MTIKSKSTTTMKTSTEKTQAGQTGQTGKKPKAKKPALNKFIARLKLKSRQTTTTKKTTASSKHSAAKKSVMGRTPTIKRTIPSKSGATKAPMAQTVIGKPSIFDFRHERGAINLHQAKKFVSLLNDIRNHLLQSESTRAIFVSMAEKFFSALPQEVQKAFEEPTDGDFYDYIFSTWPRFSAFNAQPEARDLILGWVQKGEYEPNEINILSSIVESAESATVHHASNCRLSVELYQLVIMVIVFHELSHAFTKYWFNEIVTPLDVGPTIDGSGELGFLVEEELMGGRLVVEWDNCHNFGKMDLIDQLVLVNGSHTWKIDVNTAQTVLASLRGTMFAQASKEEMKIHVRPVGACCARVTQSTENPEPVKPATIGLGIIDGPVYSFVGNDRIHSN